MSCACAHLHFGLAVSVGLFGLFSYSVHCGYEIIQRHINYIVGWNWNFFFFLLFHIFFYSFPFILFFVWKSTSFSMWLKQCISLHILFAFRLISYNFARVRCSFHCPLIFASDSRLLAPFRTPEHKQTRTRTFSNSVLRWRGFLLLGNINTAAAGWRQTDNTHHMQPTGLTLFC